MRGKSDRGEKKRGRDNIILIGMPACGKSVTGVILAKSLKMNFLDTDLLIQEKGGKRTSGYNKPGRDRHFQRAGRECP